MTEEEREKFNPDLCAEGLRYILQSKGQCFDIAETAVLVGAIMLLRDEIDDYPYLHADDSWKWA